MVIVEFLMAKPNRWEELEEFKSFAEAYEWIAKRRRLTQITYRIIKEDGTLLEEVPPDHSQIS